MSYSGIKIKIIYKIKKGDQLHDRLVSEFGFEVSADEPFTDEALLFLFE